MNGGKPSAFSLKSSLKRPIENCRDAGLKERNNINMSIIIVVAPWRWRIISIAPAKPRGVMRRTIRIY